MSYGSFVDLALARQYPELVLSLLASGAPPFEGKERWFASRPRVMWYINAATTRMPDTLHVYLSKKVGVLTFDDLRQATKENFTQDSVRTGTVIV